MFAMRSNSTINCKSWIGILQVVLALVVVTTANAQPTFSKVFGPDTIGPGSVSTLTFTIDNTAGGPVTDMAFTDNLPAGVTIATPAVVTNDCDGTVSAPDGGSSISFSDGQVGAGSSCTITVNVTSSVPTPEAPHMNISEDLTSSAGNSGKAMADLTVDTGLPGFTKSFSPSTVS